MSIKKMVFALVCLGGMSLAGLCVEPETDGKIKERIDRVDPDKNAETGSLEELKRLLMAQAEEIKTLRQQLDEQSGRLKQLEQKDGGVTPASIHSAHLVKEMAMPAIPAAPVVAQATGAQASADAPSSPLSVRIGTADFTPGGFLDFTSIFRSTNVGSGIGTSFGGIPLSNAVQGQLSESRFSAQNSRLNVKVTAKPTSNTSVTGYVETDFLGFQPANGHVTSNSNSLRLRLYWAQVQVGKWEVMAGQSWTMLTPNRVGLSPLPSDIFYTQNMDTNYQVGLTWSRDPQFRIIRHFNDHWTLGVSFENPQQFVGGAVVLPSVSTFVPQLDNGGNLGAPNWHPDIIPKLAYDGKVGERKVHVEAAGLYRSFRIFNPATNDHSNIAGGGVSLNGNFELIPNFRLILNTYYSDAGGRYIFGLGPDVIVRPEGTLSPIHSASTVAGFEYQVRPTLLWYGYYGGAYYQRNLSFGPGGPYGYGTPGNTAANRNIHEGTIGLTPTFWRKPEYGALQLITQYSYLVRTPWSAPIGAPKNAHAHLLYLNLRYVLP